MTRAAKPPEARSMADLMAEQIAAGLSGHDAPREGRKHRRRVPMRYEYHDGTEAALDWATGTCLPKSVRDWREGALVVTDMVAQIMERVRPRRLPAVPAMDYGDSPTPVLERFAAQLDLDGAWEPGWKLVELGSGSDEIIFCLAPENLDVADAVSRYDAHLERKEAANERRRAWRAAKHSGEG